MKILEYLFLIGVCFTIFEFLWAIAKFLFNLLTSSINSNSKSNGLRIAKYALLTAVSVQFIQTINPSNTLVSSAPIAIGISALVFGLYVLGKYKSRAAFAQIKGLAGQLSKGLPNTPTDPKLEIILTIGSISLFIIGSIFPFVFDNAITTWFTDAILNISTTPFFGFIFKVISVFVLINTFTTGSKILGKLASGESFTKATENEGKNPFKFFNAEQFGQDRFNKKPKEEPEYTDYEDVTDTDKT